MTLQIDCSWNQGKNRGMLTISFDPAPKELFDLSEENMAALGEMVKSLPNEGPKGLEKLEAFQKQFPSSLYLGYCLHQAYTFFQQEKDLAKLRKKLERKFSATLLYQCILAEKDLADTSDSPIEPFEGNEVLLAAFPGRTLFYYKEAIAFHEVWLKYLSMIENPIAIEKHKRFLFLIFNTHKSFLATGQSS
ncbi:MAG: hypothetical protein AAGI90_06260 [Chlamydiota bacterium]